MSIAENLRAVRAAITEAAQAAGRHPSTVQLVAVSKTYPIEAVQEAYAAGQVVFGENRVQELVPKQQALPQAQWHLIGSLQTNKVKQALQAAALIHSVDSQRLLQAIDKQAEALSLTAHVLLQINISDEDQKHGLDEPEADALLADMAHHNAYPHVQVHGLMGMAAFTDDSTMISRQFARLRQARDAFAARYPQHPRLPLEHLSMGMSGDFALAIAQGATLVRIGSAIFGHRG